MDKNLVLHICCAPDEAYVIDSIRDQYNLHCFFCNPNIAPVEEYQLRLDEAAKTAHNYNVPFHSDDYQPDQWEDVIAKYDDTPEGGERCFHCYLLRLRRTALFCQKNDFPAFTTVMSVSPHKRIGMLNECGNIAAKEFSVTYVPFDFKKNNGFLKSIALSKELGLYRQNYCGCRLSKAESEQRIQKRKLTQEHQNS
jgi:predicted adenine nucleotide alpha hydrolase (AANH) superfamily ATPase